MNYQPKTCPRCKAQMQTADGAFQLIRKGRASSESASGLPIVLYFCPQCGYLELYNLKVVGRI